MAKESIAFTILLAIFSAIQGQVTVPEQQHIPGRYEYTHSWDYAAPDSNGTIHCDETGVLWFYGNGTFADTAFQTHTLHLKEPVREVLDRPSPDTIAIDTYQFHFHYICPGSWRVDNGKFLFSEHAEGFDMVLLNESTSKWVVGYSNAIEKHSLPNSSRWFTFDIERLDEEWFIWTYTYPDGHKDSWEMKRSSK